MTKIEFDALHDGMHVPVTCENHPSLRWSCKKIAISFDKNGIGRYNFSRGLFFKYETGEECDCPGDALKLILD